MSNLEEVKQKVKNWDFQDVNDLKEYCVQLLDMMDDPLDAKLFVTNTIMGKMEEEGGATTVIESKNSPQILEPVHLMDYGEGVLIWNNKDDLHLTDRDSITP